MRYVWNLMSHLTLINICLVCKFIIMCFYYFLLLSREILFKVFLCQSRHLFWALAGIKHKSAKGLITDIVVVTHTLMIGAALAEEKIFNSSCC